MNFENNSTAIVTGGASGLGAATVKALSDKGLTVAIFDMNTDLGEARARDVGGRFFHVDVSDPVSVATALAGVRCRNGPFARTGELRGDRTCRQDRVARCSP